MFVRLFFLFIAVVALPIAAQAQSILIPVQGVLTDLDDQPIEGPKTLQFTLVNQSGESLWSEFVTLTLERGLFSVYLGQENELTSDLFGSDGVVSMELRIDGNSLGAWELGTVPYAVYAHRSNRAENSDRLDGLPAGAFAPIDHDHQPGVGNGLAVNDNGQIELAPGGVGAENLADSGCVQGQHLQWNGNQWVCADNVDTNTQLTEEQVDGFVANNDYVVGPAQACALGQVLKVTNDGWSCSEDVDTNTQLNEEQVDAFVANNQYIVGPAQPCETGQVLKASGEGWICASDQDGDTTYTAGSGLSLSNTNQFYIGAGAINQSHLASNSVRSNELADNAVDLAAMRDNSVGAAEIINDSVSQLELANNSVGNEEMQNNAIGTAELVNGAVTRAKLSQSGCQPGQLLKYQNTGWVCAPDADTNTLYTAGTGLSLSGTTFSVGQSAITAAHLAANSVGESELADNSVGYEEMQNNSIGNEEMRSNSISLTEMQDNSIGLAEMRDNSVGNAELRSNSVGNSELQDDSVGADELMDGVISNVAIASDAAISGEKIAYHDETYVPGNGASATDNGNALVAAFTNINANSVNRKVIRIGPGNFDLGTQSITMDQGLTVIGAGAHATHIYSRPVGTLAGNNSFVLRGRSFSALHHLTVTNKDAADNNSTTAIRNFDLADAHAGEAFIVSHIHAAIEGVSDNFNTAILNQGSMRIENSILSNTSGGSGQSNGLYSTNANSYTRMSDTLVRVHNNSGSSIKYSVYAGGNTTVEIYNSRLVQDADNPGDGIGLYANGNETWVYAYGSAVYGKTKAAQETNGNVTLFGGRMSNNEGSGVTCTGIRRWSNNSTLNGSCD